MSTISLYGRAFRGQELISIREFVERGRNTSTNLGPHHTEPILTVINSCPTLFNGLLLSLTTTPLGDLERLQIYRAKQVGDKLIDITDEVPSKSTLRFKGGKELVIWRNVVEIGNHYSIIHEHPTHGRTDLTIVAFP